MKSEKCGDDAVIYCGDALGVLKTLEDCSVQMGITSPPYYGLRDYLTAEWSGGKKGCNHDAAKIKTRFDRGGLTKKQKSNQGSDGNEQKYKSECPTCGAKRVDRQIGIEQTPKEYIGNLVKIFREFRRVLRDDGILFVNLGDSYAAQRGGTPFCPESLASKKDGRGSDSSKRGRKDEGYVPHRNAHAIGLKHKDRMGIPHMLAFALRENGWYWRDEICWSKPNGMTESITDRCTKAHEFIFMFAKSERYFYDHIRIKERSHLTGEMNNKRSVWHVPVGADRIAHFASYPPKLIIPCIQAGTSKHGACAKCGAPWRRVVKKNRVATRPGFDTKVTGTDSDTHGNRDPQRHVTSVKTIGWEKTCSCKTNKTKPCVVLDMFGGTGTSSAVAIENGCFAITIELNPKYIPFIRRKIRKAQNRKGFGL